MCSSDLSKECAGTGLCLECSARGLRYPTLQPSMADAFIKGCHDKVMCRGARMCDPGLDRFSDCGLDPSMMRGWHAERRVPAHIRLALWTFRFPHCNNPYACAMAPLLGCEMPFADTDVPSPPIMCGSPFCVMARAGIHPIAITFAALHRCGYSRRELLQLLNVNIYDENRHGWENGDIMAVALRCHVPGVRMCHAIVATSTSRHVMVRCTKVLNEGRMFCEDHSAFRFGWGPTTLDLVINPHEEDRRLMFRAGQTLSLRRAITDMDEEWH